jgi:branched-subunit amino acid aminotransferase/4-amino-4-deoxychorismate lyase
MDLINFNGDIIAADAPVLTVANRGFRYGDGLFESMRYLNGELMFPELHLDRLRKGMRMLKLEGYSQLDKYFLREKVEELVRRNKIGQSARVRLMIFRDGDGLYAPVTNRIGYVLQVSKMTDSQYTGNPRGLIIDVFDEVTKPVTSLSNLKTCNSLPFVLAGVFRNQHKLDDVLLLNQHGFLCEAISSNIFVVYQNQLFTPALSEGCVAGVMRQVVMHLARENDLHLVEAQISPQILNEADEVFLTNAVQGIQWVMGYNRKRYFNEMFRFLLNALNTKKGAL